MDLRIHFSQGDWERITRDWSAWWAGELDRPLVWIEGLDPVVNASRLPLPDLARETEYSASNYPLTMPAAEVIERFHAAMSARRYFGDAFPKWWPKLGAGIMAAWFGSPVQVMPDTVWFQPALASSPAQLSIRHDPENLWWRRTVELTQAAVERWQAQVCVGHTDLGGSLDILASLRGTEHLLADVIDTPDEVDWASAEITRLWTWYYDELWQIIRHTGRGTSNWGPIWSTGRCGMLQCDFCYMVSPKMFERFVLPALVESAAVLDHVFYHLDGPGQLRHLRFLLAMDHLHGIQWIPGAGAPPPEEWLTLLAQIRDVGKLCQVYVSPQGARTIVRELGGRGFLLYIRQRLSPSESQDFLELLRREDRMQPQPVRQAGGVISR